jgi:peptide-methionine (S)-S-oxide reductase
MKKATFAAGCFWGVQFNFDKLSGVICTKVGYTGGHTDSPTYETICSGGTGHAEAIEITYNSGVIAYEDLCAALWGMHDPTTLNSQGPDFGPQYRSVIFYHDEAQQKAALSSKASLTGSQNWSNSEVVTEIVAATEFFDAEDDHQKYMEKRGLTITCGG